jgi:hypothetical protein
VRQTALVDGATTGAFIRFPQNHTTHVWDPARPIIFQLVALNFVPLRHGLEMRLVHEGTQHWPNDDHQVALQLPVGSTCVTAIAVRCEMSSTPSSRYFPAIPHIFPSKTLLCDMLERFENSPAPPLVNRVPAVARKRRQLATKRLYVCYCMPSFSTAYIVFMH